MKLDPFKETHFMVFSHPRFRIWPGTRELWVQIWKFGSLIHWGGRKTGRTWKMIR